MHRLAAIAVAAALLSACPTVEPDDERLVSAVRLSFDRDIGDGFWSFPFPSDLRLIPARRAGGLHPDLWDFPNPGDAHILRDYIVFGSTVTDGFGLNSPTWFRFDGTVTLPEWSEEAARASMACEGPVRILDVDSTSPHYGTCLPARWKVVEDSMGDPWLDDHLVMVAPYWGFPMRSATTYAVYLEDVTDPDGAFVRPPEALYELLSGDSSDAELQGIYQPLTGYLADNALADGWNPGWWVAAATVFTTQNVLGEMDLLADRVLSDPDLPRWNDDEGLRLLEPEDEHFNSEFDLYDGAYTAWNFQSGEVPYSSEGGGFVWEDGLPVPQLAERVPFVVGMPRSIFEQPEEGWPVVIHAHGTGGDRFSHFSQGGGSPATLAAGRGFISIGIPQPFHGDRWPTGNDAAVSLYSFNYFNPESGVSTFRQAAIDTVALVRFVQEAMAGGGDIAAEHPDLRIDPERIYYLGHSQGGITGALAVPFTEGIKGWVLSGAGAGLSMTIMQREDPFVIRDALVTALGAPEGTQLFEMHPIVALVQMLAERTDPLNYAPYWVAESRGEPVSVLLTEGLFDAQTPADTSEALATAGRLPIVRPYEERDVFGLELRGLDSLREPYSANFEHPGGVDVTTGLAQFDENHFAIFNNADAGLLWVNFLYSMARDGAPGTLGADYP